MDCNQTYDVHFLITLSCFSLSTSSVPIMPTLSSTSPPTTRPSCASCAGTSSNSLTALIRYAGGVVATDMWATSPRNTSSPFTTASDLAFQVITQPFQQVRHWAILHPPKKQKTAPPIRTCPSTTGAKTSDRAAADRLLSTPRDVTCQTKSLVKSAVTGSSVSANWPFSSTSLLKWKIQTWTDTLWKTLEYKTVVDKHARAYFQAKSFITACQLLCRLSNGNKH